MSSGDRERVERELNETLGKALDDLLGDKLRRVTAARDKYRPLVRRLSDDEFIGLYVEVMAERPRRLAKAAAMLGGFGNAGLPGEGTE